MGEYLKRGKGKSICDIKKYHFFSHYRKNSKLSKIERTQYDRFTKELLNTYSRAIVEEGLWLKLGVLGYIRIQTKKLNFFRKDGSLSRTLSVDWDKTWKHWEKKYEGKTREEITKIEGKKVLYFDNEHTNGEFYKHLWDNRTVVIKFKRFYRFKPSRQYSRLIKDVVTQKDRKIFYYE